MQQQFRVANVGSCGGRRPSPESGYCELARLSRVCWVEFEGDLHDVPRGLYVARWRIKLDRIEYECTWRVKQFREVVGADGQTEQVLVREAHSSHITDTDTCKDRMRQLLRSKVGKGWFYLELSLWNLQDGAKRMSFSLCGGNPHWCSAMKIDSFELVPYRLDWGVERLLWLGCLKDKNSFLHCLPQNVVAIVLKRLAALEAEAEAEGEMMPRARNCEDVSIETESSAGLRMRIVWTNPYTSCSTEDMTQGLPCLEWEDGLFFKVPSI